MYSPRINRLRIEAANAKFQERFPKHELTYHSIDDISNWNEHLEKIRGKDGTFTRKLTEEESRWITNERTICKLDHIYTLTHYLFIKDRLNRIGRFEPNVAQSIVLSVLAEMEESKVELILQFLKARRLGISTIFQLLMAIRLMFYRNISAIMAASNPEDSDVLSRMALLAIERTPHWLRPLCPHMKDGIGRFKQGLFYEFFFGKGENADRSRLDLEHGTQFADIGRSQNPSVVHCTELARFDNAESLIDGGLMPAMIPSPMNLACFEGTAEGDTGWWPEKYDFNKKNYGIPGSGARMRPTFLPYFVGRDLYPTETYLISQGWYQVKDTWEPTEKTKAHALQAQTYTHSEVLLRKHLGENWEMSREQMFFYETCIKEYKANNRLHLFRRELASDDRSAWASGEKSVFEAELTMRYRDAVAQPIGVYGLKGKCGKDDVVPKRFQPIGVDHKQKSRNVIADWTHKYAPFEFELYPIRFNGYNGFDETGKILIYELPLPGEIYSMSTDNSDGKGEDSSVIKIVRKGGRGRCDAEAASFASAGISGTELWPWTLALGTMYSVMRDGKRKQPLFIPETNREGGNQLLKEMKYRGWKSESIFCEYRGKSTTRGRSSKIEGWHMSPQNRSDLIQRGIAALENEVIEVNSPAVVDEMDTFIKWPDGSIKAAKHRHDDHLISLFLGFHALYFGDARAAGKDPFIERTRAVPEEELYPLMSEPAANISDYISNVVGENFNWPT